MYLTAGAGDRTLSGASAATGDTLIGGAGNDTLTGGGGNTDVITLTAGGNDVVRFTAEADGGTTTADNITGFTTYTSSSSSSTAQTDYDRIVFLYGDVTDNAEGVFGDTDDVIFDETDDNEVAVGGYVALDADDYVEFSGVASGGSAIVADAVNVITGRGYDSLITAVSANAAAADDDGQAIVIFYNTAAQRAEMYYVSNIEEEGDADPATAGTLLAYFTDITLTGVSGLAKENFAIEATVAV